MSKWPIFLMLLAFGAIALGPSVAAQEQDPLLLIEDAAGMFNERGYLKSNSFSIDGEEIINDFNGNLMWTKRLRYAPITQNNLAFDLKLTYNGSVGHVVYSGLDLLNNADNCGPNSFNMPEWILSVNGVAVQTFNFENEAVSFNTYENDTITLDNEVAALINGYHSCYSHFEADGEYYGNISILMGDGSIKQFISMTPGNGVVAGEYRSFSKDDRTRGFVDSNWDFTMLMENGTKVVFEYYTPVWRHNVEAHPEYEDPQIYLPIRFADVSGYGIYVSYDDSSSITCGYGRPLVDYINGIHVGWVTDYWGLSKALIGGSEYFPDKASVAIIDFGIVNAVLPTGCGDANRAKVTSLTDAMDNRT